MALSRAVMMLWKHKLILTWLGAAVLFGTLVARSLAAEGPLDDPDPGRQRPGLLDSVGPTSLAPPIPGERQPGVHHLVFFVRPDQLGALQTILGMASNADLRRDAVIILAGHHGDGKLPARTVADPTGSLTRDFDMPVPRDGGPPVGYAVVDRMGLIRYRTLDPSLVDHLEEIRTMLRAVP